jgi:catechol 2,3-dioxygenase-like lactoylglutathione lyase family enzyme
VAFEKDTAPMITRIDHFVITARSVEESCDFYTRVLGFERRDRPDRPVALHFGPHKIHVHQFGKTGNLVARTPTSGAQDFCLVTERPLSEFIAHLAAHQVPIEVGPVARDGAVGAMTSVYFRDPDGNLVEVSEYLN